MFIFNATIPITMNLSTMLSMEHSDKTDGDVYLGDADWPHDQRDSSQQLHGSALGSAAAEMTGESALHSTVWNLSSET